jgi:ketosteroid isomerase-like protein
MTMNAFADEVVPLLRGEVEALHRGELGPRLALWSRTEPLTLFGAWFTARGWSQLETAFQRLADTFRGSEGFEYEVLAAEASGDLGYVVALEHTSARVGDEDTRSYTLRVTTILRRDDGAWRVVHRHGDELPLTAP